MDNRFPGARLSLPEDRYRISLTDQWSYVAPDPFDFDLNGRYEEHRDLGYNSYQRSRKVHYPEAQCNTSYLQPAPSPKKTVAPRGKRWVWVEEEKKVPEVDNETWIWNGRTIRSVPDPSAAQEPNTSTLGEETRKLCEEASLPQNASNNRIENLLDRLGNKLEEKKHEEHVSLETTTTTSQAAERNLLVPHQPHLLSPPTPVLLPEAPAPQRPHNSTTAKLLVSSLP